MATTPLPKSVGWLSWLFVVLPAVYAGYQTGGWQGAVAALIAILGGTVGRFSHSANGTGGTPSNP